MPRGLQTGARISSRSTIEAAARCGLKSIAPREGCEGTATDGCDGALLTNSGTGALELTATLAGVGPGDEVIMPSYTFVSTANAFALRGGTPVFVDIRVDTMNLDERLIEEAITERTRAIVVVHYAGVSCAMDGIMAIAERHGLIVIEDAAHALLSAFDGRPLGSIGHLGTLSFHETKNVHCGEGAVESSKAPSP